MSKAGVRVKARFRAKKRQAVGRAVKLFALGVSVIVAAALLAVLFSRALGYALGLASAAISVYIISRWRGEKRCLMLGEALLALSAAFVIAVFASQYIGGARAIETTAPEALISLTPRPEVLRGFVGMPVDVDTWRITLEEVKEVKHISADGRNYSSREGMKVVLAKIRIENVGKSKTMPSVRSYIWNPTLLTDANGNYTRIYPSSLVSVSELSAEAEVERYVDLDLSATLRIEPGNHIEGHVMFQIPENEKPKELQLNVGLPEPTRVIIAIQRDT